MFRKLKKAYASHPDITAISLIFATFLIVFLTDMFVLNRGAVWGSKTDWSCQHFAIPEYFRMRFYETHDIFPDSVFQLGAGQNIYDLAYYGIAAPLYLPAYLMPWMTMCTYIQVLSIIIAISSAVLAYYFFKGHFGGVIPLVLALMFILAGPIIYHSHRHIMFVNYFPFLFGLLFAARKPDSVKWLFLTAFFSFCIICTSYYFSAESFAAVLLYMVYLSVEKNGRFSLKTVLGETLRKLLFMFIGTVCAAIMWLPSLAAILTGRAVGSVEIPLLRLILPSVELDLLLYSPASPGLTCVAAAAVIALLINGKKHERLLAAVTAVFAVFPCVTYLLNGMMYIDAKTLIPFIPMILLLCGSFFGAFYRGEINVKLVSVLLTAAAAFTLIEGVRSISQSALLIADVIITSFVMIKCRKNARKWILLAETAAFALVSALVVCGWDRLAKKSDIEEFYNSDVSSLVDDILDSSDEAFRFAEDYGRLMNVNRVYRTDYLTTNIYSSLSNADFRSFRLYSSGSDVDTRNNAIQLQPMNIIFNSLMGCRYRITSAERAMLGETKYSSAGKYYIYENSNALPLGYASADIISEEDFHSLPWESQQGAILGNIIVPDTESSAANPTEAVPVKLDFEAASENSAVSYSDGVLRVDSRKPISFELDLDEPLEGKILLIKCTADNRFGKLSKQGDIVLTLNGIENKLTAPTWKYHNGNYNFNYIVSSPEPIKQLEVEFSKGRYTISALEAYALEASVLENAMSNKDALVIEHKRPLGDTLSGHINVTNDGWFNISMPYDKNYRIYVDGKKTDYVRTNTAFIGFPITSGEHEITLTYEAPMKREGIVLGTAGLIVLMILLAVTALRGKQKKSI